MQTKLAALISDAVPQANLIAVDRARSLILAGSWQEALGIIEPLADSSFQAALMLAQVRAYLGDWSEAKELSLALLHNPFDLCQYRDAQDVMKIFAMAATASGDWPSAISQVEAVRAFLEATIDMSGESSSFSESFNRFEGYIRSAGRGKPPFKINSPVAFAAMGEEQYAKLIGLKHEGGKKALTFAQLDEASRRDFHLWKALYDEDLEQALKLFEGGKGIEDSVRSLNQAALIAQLLLSSGNTADEERAWQIILGQMPRWTRQYFYEIAPIDLLWDEKLRPLITPERGAALLATSRSLAKIDKADSGSLTEQKLYERERLTHIATLGRTLSDEAVALFEEQVVASPDSDLVRCALIGAFSKFSASGTAARLPHVIWFCQKFCSDAIIEDILPYLLLDKESCPDGFERFKERWLEIVQANPRDTRILFNASLLLGADDPALAEELLGRAQSLDAGDLKIAERLFELNAFQTAVSGGDRKIRHAKEALTQIEVIEKARLEGQGKSPVSGQTKGGTTGFDELRHLRRQAWFSLEAGLLDAAARLSDEMLNLAHQADFGERYEYLHEVIAGRLSVRVGETRAAMSKLSGLREKGLWRHFKSDMPHMTLLAEIVAAGGEEETQAAIALLLETREDWPESEKSLIERTVKAISDGETPWVTPVRL